MFKKDLHYSQDLETAILGACLLEPAFARTYGTIDENTFYFDRHRDIYKAMKEMYEAGTPIDCLTVTDYLVRKKGIEEIYSHPTGYFVTRLTNSVVSSAHVEYHCHVIKTMWIERELINLTHGGLKTEGSARKKIIELQEKLQELNTKAAESDWMDMSELMVKLYQHQAEMEKAEGMGLTTGFKKLDRVNGGLHPGQMIVIGARPSVGKSALVGKMAIEIAKTGKKVGIISLEMKDTEIAARLAAIDSEVNFDVMYRSLYTDKNQRHAVYNQIAKQTAHLPIFISDKTGVNIYEIRAKAEKLKHSHGLDCLIIDYLQLVDSDERKNYNREQEVSRISRGSKIMAKEMNIPVIQVCQLNREVTKRKGASRFPELSDLRESGSLEQDSDVVMFLHRDWMSGIEANENGFSTEREADLVIRKWRNGMSNWMLKLDFDPPKMNFSERGGFTPVKIESTDITEPGKEEMPF